jgi:uncharacterized membrane protein HdeD (DUF308 family)
MAGSTARELRPATTLWPLLAAFGAVVLALGIFFVVSPEHALSTISVIVGILLLIDGVLALIASVLGRGEGRGLIALVGALSGIAGLILIKHPFHSLVAFTMIVGVWFVVAGVMRLVSTLPSADERAAGLAIGGLDLLGGIVLLAWPDLGLKTAAVIIGIVLVLRGALFLSAGWQLRRFGHEYETTPHTPTPGAPRPI